MSIFIKKQKHKKVKKIHRPDHSFPARLTYANKNIRRVFFIFVNTNFDTTEDMFNKLQP